MNAQTTYTPGARAPAKPPVPQGKTAIPAQAGISSQPVTAANSEVQPDGSAESPLAFIEPERRLAMIAEAAYYRAERRGFEPGRELEDWYLAEGEIDEMLTRGEIPAVCGIEDLD